MSVPATQVGPGAQAAAAFRTFVRIAELWRLNVEQQLVLLGQPSRSTYYKWRKERAEHLPTDTLERLSYLLGIYKALQILFPDPARADAWLWKPNDTPIFGGRPAMERMLQGQVIDLYAVREYLDAQLGG